MQAKLLKGNNIELLKTLEANSVDAVVTDPPYGLSFMNKKWDYDVPSIDFWKEVYRVLKPGGHILSFGGTRTYHRMVVNIEDAGFEIRDCIQWIYGSGFPKSLNVGKAVDKLEGNEREVIGTETTPYKVAGICGNTYVGSVRGDFSKITDENGYRINEITKGQTQWEGWGTGLKPANEPIVLARKPLDEKTIVENVLKYGTGGINIDGCRVGTDGGTKAINFGDNKGEIFGGGKGKPTNDIQELNEGRFPANVILECICDEVIKGEKGERVGRAKVNNHNENSIFGIGGVGIENYDYNDKGDIHTNPECPCYIMDEQSGESKSQSGGKSTGKNFGGETIKNRKRIGHDDKGGASRFFYVAKVSKKERNLGLNGFEDKENPSSNYGFTQNYTSNDLIVKRELRKNNHPTVKPINLLTYLIRLITPPNGVVLDAFMGSGSTGIAALLEGKQFIGMEMDDDYFNIAEARINNYEQYRQLLKK